MTEQPDTSDHPNDGLEQAEHDYFNSRGEKTDGLAAPATVPDQVSTPSAPAQTSPAVPAADPTSEPDDEGVETVTGADGKQQRRVNYPKYQREVERRKAAEAAAATLNEKFARADERMRLINEALSPATPQGPVDDDPEPDPEQDIFAHNKWLARRNARISEQLAAFNEERQTERQEAETVHWYRGEAEKFAATTPDFPRAYVHLIRNRLAELEAYGVSDPAERDRMVLAEERDLVARARKDGVSPAERLYTLAKGRGYVKELAPAPNGNGNHTAVPGQQPAPAPQVPGSLATAPAKANVTEEINRLKQGQSAALSLSNVGGAPGDQLTPEVLANMSDDEFAEVFSRLQQSGNKTRLKQLMGG